MSIEQSLSTLLLDAHLEKSDKASILEFLLDRWDKNPEGSNFIERFSSLGASRELLPYQLRGPSVPIKKHTVRLARIMCLEGLVDYHLSGIALPRGPTTSYHFKELAKLDENDKNWSDLPLSGNPLRSWSEITWACLDEELRSYSVGEVQSGLGLHHYSPGTDLVSISYEIDSNNLRVPTIVDAHLQPWFVSKPSIANSLPRSWDWENNRWGLSEIVHRYSAPVSKLKIRLLGTTTSKFVPYFDGLANFVPEHSPDIDDLFAQTLRQLRAHKDLEEFISGKTDFFILSPNEFERFIGLLYERKGYKTIVTKSSHDGGYDVIAFSDDHSRKGILIQAKHTRGVVGIRIIRELIGARFLSDPEYSSFIIAVATTGRFSRKAIQAQESHATQIQLLDYSKLQAEIRNFRNIGVRDIVQEAVDSLHQA